MNCRSTHVFLFLSCSSSVCKATAHPLNINAAHHLFLCHVHLTLDLEDGLGKAANVPAGDAGDGDAAVLGGVDGELLGELGHLVGGETGVGEHANLGGDVGPVVLGAELLEVLLEESAHGDDAVGHALELGEPLLAQLGVGENGGGDAGAVDGRVGVDGADDDLELGVDTLLLGGVLADNGESTNTLTIETL